MLKVNVHFGFDPEKGKTFVCIMNTQTNKEVARAVTTSPDSADVLSKEIKKKVDHLDSGIKIEKTYNGSRFSETENKIVKTEKVGQETIEQVNEALNQVAA